MDKGSRVSYTGATPRDPVLLGFDSGLGNGAFMRILIAMLAFCASGYGQSVVAEEERIKVGGIENPFWAGKIEIRPMDESLGKGLELFGTIWNKSETPMYFLVADAVISRNRKPPLVIPIHVEFIGASDYNYFQVPLPTLSKTDEAVGIKLLLKEALDYKGKIERAAARERERLAEDERRRQAEEKVVAELKRRCTALRLRISKKPVALLTVEEADGRDSCRAAGYW